MSAKRKVLLIGWDSADWRLLSPLLDRGLMPALSGVVERGVMGNLSSIEPILSPLVWTSIATGKFPHKHGVLGFVEPDPLGGGIRNVGSTTRRTKALWNILSDAGLATHIIGWYASHPAEAIRGASVSDRFPLVTSNARTPWPLSEGAVRPLELAATLAPFRVHPREIEGSQLLPFVPRARELDQANPAVAQRLNAIARILAETASLQAAATWTLENHPWDFAAVYFRALDDFGHHFMPFHPPAAPGVGADEAATYGQVMEAACCFHDLLLARLLQCAGPDATVILVSDHGFESGRHRPGAVANELNTMSQWHRPFGVFAMAGPGIRQDERLYGGSVLDIAPTVLALFDLPVGQDMDGKVLVNAFATAPEIQRIPTWESAPPGAAAPGAAPAEFRPSADEEAAVLDHLVALGYLEPPDGDTQRLIQTAANELSFNRITSLVMAQAHAEAEAEARQLAAAHPDEPRFRLKLVQVLLFASKLPEARAELEAAEARLGPSPAGDRMFANLLLMEGRADDAMTRLQHVAGAAPGDLGAQEQMGRVLLVQRRWREAEQRFRHVLEEEPESPTTLVGLAQALARQQKDVEALEAALAAVSLQHFLPAGHFQLGAVLTKLRFPERAIQAFEAGLVMQPGNALAHRYLFRLYRHIGRVDRAEVHRRRLRELDPQGPEER